MVLGTLELTCYLALTPCGQPNTQWGPLQMLGSLLMTNPHLSTSDLQGLCQRAMSTCMTEDNTGVAAIAAHLVCSNICWHPAVGGAALTEVPAGPASSRGHRDGAHSCD